MRTTKGDGKEVKIATPVWRAACGTTNDKEVLEEVGLPAYPGSTAGKESKDNRRTAPRNVDMKLRRFLELRVKAVRALRPETRRTKVEAFYRGELKALR